MKAKELKLQGIPITLGEKTYDIRFDMNTFCELEEVYEDINQAFDDLQKMKMKAIRALIYAAVKAQNEEVTLKEVGAMLGVNDLEEISTAINKALSEAMPEINEDDVGE